MLPFFPLANGLLTGKVRRGQEVPEGSRLAEPRRAGLHHRRQARRGGVAHRLGRGAGRVASCEIAIGGLAAQPGCSSVIAGATSPAQVRANAAAGEWEPTADQLAAIDKLVPPPATEL